MIYISIGMHTLVAIYIFMHTFVVLYTLLVAKTVVLARRPLPPIILRLTSKQV